MSILPTFNLPLVRYQFELMATTPLSLPRYAGSTWRGAFGTALRRSVCLLQQATCEGCLLQTRCVYHRVFETPAGKEPLLARAKSAPHPFIFHPLNSSGQQYAVGESLRIQLTLIGQTINDLPYFIHSVQQMGLHGLGQAKQGKFNLLQVWQEQQLGAEDWRPIYSPTSGGLAALACPTAVIPPAPLAVQIQFKTPFRATHQGSLVDGASFELGSFLMGLIRRLSLLSAYHVPRILEADFVSLRQLAQQIRPHTTDFDWYGWRRYSNRQQHVIAMDGMLGNFDLVGTDWQVFWPWLWWGQWTHAGKGTVMGLGEYRLVAKV